MVVPPHDEEEDEGWEWVHAPPGRHHHDLHHGAAAVDNEYGEDDGFFCREDDGAAGPSAGLLSNTARSSESLSSTASSPILKQMHAVMVIPKEHVSAIDSLQHSASEWIEPQLVFSKQHGIRFDGLEIYEVVTYLQNLPKAKEALLSLLGDPVVFDAVMRNQAFKELAGRHKDSDGGSERLDLNYASASSSLYKHGKKAYKLLRQKLRTAVDILLSLLGRDKLERNVADDLDATVKSCILVVAILVLLVIGKRSNKMICWARVL